MPRKDLSALHDLLPRVLARLAEESGQGRTLTPVWQTAAGEHIARHSRPHSLTAGTLVISVQNAEWARTLEGQSESLRERLNAQLGAGTVRTLAFRLDR